MKAAVLIDQMFEDPELIYPYYRLQEAGYDTDLVGDEEGETYEGKQGVTKESDKALSDTDISNYDVLLIPGGYLPDKMRKKDEAVELVQNAFDEGLTVGAVCHAGQLLVEADVLDGREATGYQSIRTSLENAGAEVKDQEVVVDGNLITSRKPDDLPAFMEQVVNQAS